MSNKSNTQKKFSFVELALVLSCCVATLLLAKCGMYVNGKLTQGQSLMLTSELVESMPLIFKDAMSKNRNGGSVSDDSWERSEINRFVKIKIYREQKNVAWRMGVNQTGLIQKKDAGELQVTMRGLYLMECDNIQKMLSNNKDVSGVQINKNRIEYRNTCENTTDNTIVYNQKI